MLSDVPVKNPLATLEDNYLLSTNMARRKQLLKDSQKNCCLKFAKQVWGTTANIWKKVFWSDEEINLPTFRVCVVENSSAHQFIAI